MAKIKSHPITITIDTEVDDSVASGTLEVSGTLRGIVCDGSADMTGATYTLAITDKNGGTVFSRASITKNVTTEIWADKYGGTAEYSPLETPMAGPITVTITSVGNEAADRTFVVYVYFE